ncbi:MAG TPA: hypothetical protein VM692_12920 [Gammaproteobacteria bacterium]|nr:hypothetical protein [Gammaproteobacteria bacterium]
MAAIARSAWALLLAASAAAAQPSAAPVDPVVVNFRAYRAALERNDLAAAETAAAAALAASEAAQGRRTAVLALNLANVRLALGDRYDALSPAQTAHTLATSSADSDVDPRVAALTLGRAEIAADERSGSRRLVEAIAAAEADTALASEVYDAAVALGRWAFDEQEYATAQQAWATAKKLAATTADPAYSRASALIGEGASIFLRNANPREVQTGSRMTKISTPDAQSASDAFVTAQALLLPAAYAATPPQATLTAGQSAFAQAMAWQGALYARIETLNEPLPLPPSTLGMQDIPSYDRRGECSMRASNAGPEIEYPTEALFRYGVGAVVAHFALDTDGTIRARTIAASIPPGPLAEAVEASLDQWRIEKLPSSSASCCVPPSYYAMVRFVLQ